MKSFITILLVLITVFLGVANVKLRIDGVTLSEKIISDQEQCQLKMAQLKNDYQLQIADLRNYLLSQNHQTSPAEKNQRHFSQFISYSHRVKAVTRKYGFLLDNVELAENDIRELKKLLLERERLASVTVERNDRHDSNEIRQHMDKLAQTEAKIQIMLQRPDDYENYLRVRDNETR